MTILLINNFYPTDRGFLIPRSHLGGDDNNPFCVVDLLIMARNDCYIKQTKTMTRKELKQELHLSKTERIEIV
jgi:hypothetical protein